MEAITWQRISFVQRKSNASWDEGKALRRELGHFHSVERLTNEGVENVIPVDFESEVKVDASTRNAVPGHFRDVSEAVI